MNTARLYIYSLICKFLPPTRCFGLKASLLRWCGAKVGKNTEIVSSAKIMGDLELDIGDNVFIGHEAMIFGPAGSKITLEDYCKVGSRAVLVTGSHEYSLDYPSIAGPGTCKSLIIKRGASVGTNAIVLPGKTIGNKSHVAAGSVVTHDVPDKVRVAGIPAHVIKDFTKSD